MHEGFSGQVEHHDQQVMMCAGARDDPLILDSDPLPYTQGRILSYDKNALTVDAELLEGYKPPVDNGSIKLFTPEGVMLPHTQDPTQGFEDLGELACQIYPVHRIQSLPRSPPCHIAICLSLSTRQLVMTPLPSSSIPFSLSVAHDSACSGAVVLYH